MTTNGRLARALACAALVASLAGCGGGGGGGDSGGSTGVTVHAPSPASISAEVLVDELMQNVTLNGTIAGDVNSLSGKTVYVVIEDPASLFESSPDLMLQNLGGAVSYSLSLRGRALHTPGLVTGKLIIHACLDAQCAVHLGGTPISVPFSVNVLPGVVLSTTRLDINVPFGTVPPEQRVDVTLPAGSPGWVASVTTPYVYGVPRTVSVQPEGMWVTADHLQLKLAAAPPGSYVETVRVHASVQLPDGRAHDYDPVIEVHYTVTDNASLDYVFDPSQLNLMRASTDPLIQEVGYSLVTNTGVTAQLMGIEYLSSAGSTGPFNSWWSEYPYRENHVCTSTMGAGGTYVYDCLVPGLYTAQVRYRLTAPSGTHDVLLPISLTVTP